MAPTIRTATAVDAPQLPAIERSGGESFRAIPELAWVADDNVISADEHLPRIASGTVWVAEEEGELVGFLTAEVFGDELHIWEVAVRHNRQRRGVGRGLLAVAETYARAAGLAALTLTTFRDVAWNEPFYARLGYRTLDDVADHPRLVAVLDREAGYGLPRDKRCAMRRAL